MKIHRYSRLWGFVAGGVLYGGLLFSAYTSAADVNQPTSSNAVVTIPVTISNPQPSCNINVPGGNTRYLGTLNRSGSDQTHNTFTIEVSCQGNVRTKIKANATNGVLQSDGARLAVNVGGSISSAGPFLKLKADNRFVKLRDSYDDWFCIAGTAGNTQICSVTPVTESNGRTPAGTGEATVAFTIDYFL